MWEKVKGVSTTPLSKSGDGLPKLPSVTLWPSDCQTHITVSPTLMSTESGKNLSSAPPTLTMTVAAVAVEGPARLNIAALATPKRVKDR